MSALEKLVRASPCGRCGSTIPAGTELKRLDWDAARRVWSHREPECEPVGVKPSGSAAGSSLGPTSLSTSPLPEKTDGNGSGGGALGERTSSGASESTHSDPSTSGAWSVTVELHEAADPAQSKRVLRIGRLHLGTLEEARRVAELLRKEG